MREFALGDVVRLKNGEAPQKVIAAGTRGGHEQMLKCRYLSAGDDNFYDDGMRWRKASDYVLIKSIRAEEPKQETKMANLYQTKTGEVEFGTKLAMNSKGQIVLEMKGTGEIRAVDPNEVEIVRPYTVKVVNISAGQTTDRVAIKGSVSVGDFLVDGLGQLCKIAELDTKSPSPKGKLSGRKLVTEALVEVAAEEGEGE